MALSVPRCQTIFPLKVPNISKLNYVNSEQVIVQKIPWYLRIQKKTIDAKQWLAVYLYCKQKNVPPEWNCSASLSVKLHSFDANMPSIERRLNPYVHDTSGIGYGIDNMVEWCDLFDPAKSYVKDDAIELEIKIEVTDPSGENKATLTFEAQDKCCEKGSLAKYLLTVANVDKLMAVRSPEFKLRNLPFDLTMFKSNSVPTACLYIRVRSKMIVSNDEILNMRVTCKLLSFKSDGNPKELIQTENFRAGNIFSSNGIISWAALFDTQAGFVENNTIKIQLKMEAFELEEVTPANKRRVSIDEADLLQMECAICLATLKNQNVSSTECGHLFCTACIEASIRNRNTCPSCNVQITADKFRRLYLPIRN